jgi:hypothetical protein
MAADTIACSLFSTGKGPSSPAVSDEDEDVMETSKFSCDIVVWYKRDGGALFKRVVLVVFPLMGASRGGAAEEVRPNADIMLWMSTAVPRSRELGSTRLLVEDDEEGANVTEWFP